jgi:hypothetical protein
MKVWWFVTPCGLVRIYTQRRHNSAKVWNVINFSSNAYVLMAMSCDCPAVSYILDSTHNLTEHAFKTEPYPEAFATDCHHVINFPIPIHSQFICPQFCLLFFFLFHPLSKLPFFHSLFPRLYFSRVLPSASHCVSGGYISVLCDCLLIVSFAIETTS